MFKHLLVATDGSSAASAASRTALRLARACGASVTAVHVIEPFRAVSYGQMMLLPQCEAGYLDQARREAGHCLDGVKNMASEAGISCACVHEVSTPIHRTIEDIAHARACDLIVTGSHGHRGLQRLLLGSETQKILFTTGLPVLVCPEPPAYAGLLDDAPAGDDPREAGKVFRKMLLVVDGSEGAHRCALRCMELAVALGCEVQALYVMSPLAAIDRIADVIEGDVCRERATRRAHMALDEIAEVATARGVPLVSGYAVDTRYDVTILDHARHGGCDLVVMHGHAHDARSLRHVARNVILDGETPVLIFP
jgi:nucleotide-binding universal stress UspA family protein